MCPDIQLLALGTITLGFLPSRWEKGIKRDGGIFGHRSLIETISSSLFRGCGFSLYNEIGFPCPFNQRQKCFGGRVICREGGDDCVFCYSNPMQGLCVENVHGWIVNR